jgi:V/A-type H+-transporting ATPase subunit I
MIAKMSRVYIAVRQADKDHLLDRLGQMNLLHIEPVKAEKADADEEILQALADIDRAIQILSSVRPAERTPFLEPLNAARAAIDIQSAVTDNQNRLVELHHRMEALKIWGNVRLKQFEDLRESGVEIRFFSLPQKQAGRIQTECAEAVARLSAKRLLVAVIDRPGQFKMPAGADPVRLPPRDRPSLLAEAAKIEENLKQGHRRLSQLAGQVEALHAERMNIAAEIAYVTAQRSGLSQGDLFAVQGWLPSEKANQLEFQLTNYGIYAAVSSRPAEEEEAPPTLIRYSSWARPIQGLFDMLGTLPGYREMDLSLFFMLALPVFAAMLIGDAGYGLLISLAGLIFYSRLTRVAGRSTAQIVIIFGLVTLLWGVLNANYFGVTPETLAKAGGFVKSAEAGDAVDYEALWSGTGFYSQSARMMRRTAPLWRQDPKLYRFLLIKVSLIIGCLHLILARLRKAVELIPDQRALAELGWIITLADMLVLIWHVLFIGADRVPAVVWWIFLAAMLLSSGFTKPDRSMFKRLLLGFAASMLPLLSTFSDTMSYVRLFAAGLASYYIASAFNSLGVKMAETATWFAAVPVLIFGHGLNIGLATIAIFAHGVRLNMLEFSNNAGVQWGGYAYRPFSANNITSSGKEPL